MPFEALGRERHELGADANLEELHLGELLHARMVADEPKAVRVRRGAHRARRLRAEQSGLPLNEL